MSQAQSERTPPKRSGLELDDLSLTFPERVQKVIDPWTPALVGKVELANAQVTIQDPLSGSGAWIDAFTTLVIADKAIAVTAEFAAQKLLVEIGNCFANEIRPDYATDLIAPWLRIADRDERKKLLQYLYEVRNDIFRHLRVHREFGKRLGPLFKERRRPLPCMVVFALAQTYRFDESLTLAEKAAWYAFAVEEDLSPERLEHDAYLAEVRPAPTNPPATTGRKRKRRKADRRNYSAARVARKVFPDGYEHWRRRERMRHQLKTDADARTDRQGSDA